MQNKTQDKANHLLFARKLQHVISHYCSNKGSVINKQTSLINNPF